VSNPTTRAVHGKILIIAGGGGSRYMLCEQLDRTKLLSVSIEPGVIVGSFHSRPNTIWILQETCLGRLIRNKENHKQEINGFKQNDKKMCCLKI
jgi:hypothetical protein